MSRIHLEGPPTCIDCGGDIQSIYGKRCTTLHVGADIFFKSKETLEKEKSERIKELKKRAVREKKEVKLEENKQ